MKMKGTEPLSTEKRQAGGEAIEHLFSLPKFRIVDVMSVRGALQRSSVEIEQGERWCVKFYSSSTSF